MTLQEQTQELFCITPRKSFRPLYAKANPPHPPFTPVAFSAQVRRKVSKLLPTLCRMYIDSTIKLLSGRPVRDSSDLSDFALPSCSCCWWCVCDNIADAHKNTTRTPPHHVVLFRSRAPCAGCFSLRSFNSN